MYRFFICYILFVYSAIGVNCQTYIAYNDTVHLILNDTLRIKEVEIISPVSKKPEVGRKTETYTALQKQNAISGTLTNLISRYSPVYIKTDAGGLATFRIRGTSSNHTSVLIGGIDINSLTLGSSNANNIPVFLFDDISLAYGASSASVGSGSIGGAVRLGLKENWTKGANGESLMSLGSFGEKSLGSKLFLGNGRIESVTGILVLKKENNFPFLNTGYFDVEQQSYPRDTLKYSALNNFNVIQQLNFKINQHQKIKSFFWFSGNHHEVQPTNQQNLSKELAPHVIDDKNFRSWVSYSNNANEIDFKIEAGFVKDKTIDNNNYKNTIGTKRFVSNIDLVYKSDVFKLQFDTKYKYIKPVVYAYDNDIREQHLDLHGAIISYPIKNLTATINLRQQFVTNYNAPFTPALGLQYIFNINSNQLLKLTGNIQKSYRIPTFNDRYWNQSGYSGNKKIKPEDVNNFETGIHYKLIKDKFSFESNLSAYYMDVNNWLLWLNNTTKWEVRNIYDVTSKGIELHMHSDIKINKTNLGAGLNIAINKTVDKETKLNSENSFRKDKQLIYTPKTLGNIFFFAKYRGYTIHTDASYTGFRYYNNTNKKLKAYSLLNTSVSKEINFNKNSLIIDYQVNNILSEQYENQYNYAMPEIQHRLIVKFNFNNK